MKNNLKIFILLFILVAALLTTIYAGKSFFPEPKVTPPGKPDDVKWDSELGSYISPDLTKNPQTGQYYDKVINPNGLNVNVERQTDPADIWRENIKKSKNKIDKVLADYIEYRNIYPRPDEAMLTGWAEKPSSDFKFVEFVVNELNIRDLPELASRMDETYGCMYMVYAFKEITNFNDEILFNPTDEGCAIFVKELKTILGKRKERVDKKDNIANLGLLALPYVSDKILAGDDEYLAYMPEMMDQNLKTDKKELMKKDKTFWKTWLKDNKEEIEILRNLK